jgi:hypothetical protein
MLLSRLGKSQAPPSLGAMTIFKNKKFKKNLKLFQLHKQKEKWDK